MKVLLRAFNLLEGEFEVKDLREKIYLHHRKPYLEKSFKEGDVFPTLPSFQKAVFEYAGRYLSDKPIFEFIGLE